MGVSWWWGLAMRLRVLFEADAFTRGLERSEDPGDRARAIISNLRAGRGLSREVLELAAQLGDEAAQYVMRNHFEDDTHVKLPVLSHEDGSRAEYRVLLDRLEGLFGRKVIAGVAADCFLQAAGSGHPGIEGLRGGGWCCAVFGCFYCFGA